MSKKGRNGGAGKEGKRGGEEEKIEVRNFRRTNFKR